MNRVGTLGTVDIYEQRLLLNIIMSEIARIRTVTDQFSTTAVAM